MRILFLTQVLPYPLDAGPKTRAYYTLCYLARQHDITLVCFIRADDPPDAVEHLRGICQAVHTVPIRRSRLQDAWHLVRSLPSPTPFLIARDSSAMMVALVRRLANQRPAFDAIHADQLWMAPYAMLARQASNYPHPPSLILDQHNAVFQIPRRMAERQDNWLIRALLWMEERKLARYESQICQNFDDVVWVTAEDQAAVSRQTGGPRQAGLNGQARSTIIPICVDTETHPRIRRRPDAHRVTFLGGLHWPPNAEGVVWFARHVWPKVQQQAPGAILTIIGKQPPRPLFATDRTRHLSAAIEITGYVPDPTPYLEETAVFVVPLHAGGGMRVKILDAWRWGLPVVSTTIGAEGIAVRDGDNLLLADTATAMAGAIVRLLRNPTLAARLAVEGRRTVEEQYHWRTTYQAWNAVYGAAPMMAAVTAGGRV